MKGHWIFTRIRREWLSSQEGKLSGTETLEWPTCDDDCCALFYSTFFTTPERCSFSIFRLITRGTNPAWRGSRVVQVDVKGWSCLFLGNVYRKLLGWNRRKSRIPNNEKTTILCREGANSRTIWRTIFAIFFLWFIVAKFEPSCQSQEQMNDFRITRTPAEWRLNNWIGGKFYVLQNIPYTLIFIFLNTWN